MKIAVIGSGIAGLGAAWALGRRHDVTLLEAQDRLGGHANTVDLHLGQKVVPVDTGFIVYNERNYPNLTQLFHKLGVETAKSDMSFSISLEAGKLEYAGSIGGLFAQPTNVFRPSFWRLLRELFRFYREAHRFGTREDLLGLTLGKFLSDAGYSDAFARRHILPMAAAIWSAPFDEIMAFPAKSFVHFFENHGLFEIRKRPQWRSVLGGSRRYVEALKGSFQGRILLSTPISAVTRTPAGVLIRSADGVDRRFDQLVIATHADQALEILGHGASGAEREILSAFRYQRNRAVLHSDAALMPRRRAAWASWNYHTGDENEAGGDTSVTYWMNRLQSLNTLQNVFVTLNPINQPTQHHAHRTFIYDHPLFDHSALTAQARLPEIQGSNRVWYCGSYCGYGFHEDGLQAGLSVAAALGAQAPWAERIEPMSPAHHAVTPFGANLAAE
jgi:predicted NAD/FAD-binding protein